jgi:hypothetical protein
VLRSYGQTSIIYVFSAKGSFARNTLQHEKLGKPTIHLPMSCEKAENEKRLKDDLNLIFENTDKHQYGKNKKL